MSTIKQEETFGINIRTGNTWYKSLLITYPEIIITSYIFLTLLITPINFWLHDLPTFSDPIKGFSTQNTYIARQSSTSRLLEKAIDKTNGLFTLVPVINQHEMSFWGDIIKRNVSLDNLLDTSNNNNKMINFKDQPTHINNNKKRLKRSKNSLNKENIHLYGKLVVKNYNIGSYHSMIYFCSLPYILKDVGVFNENCSNDCDNGIESLKDLYVNVYNFYNNNKNHNVDICHLREDKWVGMRENVLKCLKTNCMEKLIIKVKTYLLTENYDKDDISLVILKESKSYFLNRFNSKKLKALQERLNGSLMGFDLGVKERLFLDTLISDVPYDIVVTTLSVMPFLNWHLNVVESTIILLTVGLSFDFVLHYAISYSKVIKVTSIVSGTAILEKTSSSMGLITPRNHKHKSIITAINDVIYPIFVSATTTSVTGIAMTMASTLSFHQIGVFMITMAFVSFILSTFFFMSLLSIFGPYSKKEQSSMINHGKEQINSKGDKYNDGSMTAPLISKNFIKYSPIRERGASQPNLSRMYTRRPSSNYPIITEEYRDNLAGRGYLDRKFSTTVNDVAMSLIPTNIMKAGISILLSIILLSSCMLQSSFAASVHLRSIGGAIIDGVANASKAVADGITGTVEAAVETGEKTDNNATTTGDVTTEVPTTIGDKNVDDSKDKKDDKPTTVAEEVTTTTTSPVTETTTPVTTGSSSTVTEGSTSTAETTTVKEGETSTVKPKGGKGASITGAIVGGIKQTAVAVAGGIKETVGVASGKKNTTTSQGNSTEATQESERPKTIVGAVIGGVKQTTGAIVGGVKATVDAAMESEDKVGKDKATCQSQATCYGDTDCNGGKCLGVYVGTCNCNACINFMTCTNDEGCGGLKGACDEKTHRCICQEAHKKFGFEYYIDTLTKFCNKQTCNGKSDSCNGLPCSSGRCYC
uniref:SSD domain-containing protein n=1 Tax=Parastrongyloides trichosuri TaxID=131310 RepID=A0A0N4ZLA0_PARTI